MACTKGMLGRQTRDGCRMSARVEAAAKEMAALAEADNGENEWRDFATAAIAAADAVMFDGAAVERVAEAMWLHRPMERVYDEGPNIGGAKPWKDLKPYQHDRYRGWAAAVLAALIEGDDK